MGFFDLPRFSLLSRVGAAAGRRTASSSRLLRQPPKSATAFWMAGAAFLRSSGIIAGVTSMLALKAKNQGSASAGSCEGPSIFMISSAVRLPLSAMKYAASGFCSARIFAMAEKPSFAPALPASVGIEILNKNRIVSLS